MENSLVVSSHPIHSVCRICPWPLVGNTFEKTPRCSPFASFYCKLWNMADTGFLFYGIDSSNLACISTVQPIGFLHRNASTKLFWPSVGKLSRFFYIPSNPFAFWTLGNIRITSMSGQFPISAAGKLKAAPRCRNSPGASNCCVATAAAA